MMINLNDFITIEGSKSDKDLVFLGLSTCGFCKRAKAFLEEEDYSFRFVYVDELEPDTRAVLKDDVKQRFSPDIIYPFLIIDDSDYIKGFRKEQWLEKLG